jgi:hypothetical protein
VVELHEIAQVRERHAWVVGIGFQSGDQRASEVGEVASVRSRPPKHNPVANAPLNSFEIASGELIVARDFVVVDGCGFRIEDSLHIPPLRQASRRVGTAPRMPDFLER